MDPPVVLVTSPVYAKPFLRSVQSRLKSSVVATVLRTRTPALRLSTVYLLRVTGFAQFSNPLVHLIEQYRQSHRATPKHRIVEAFNVK